MTRPPHPFASLPGVLTAEELAATVQSIADLQLPSGLILWTPGGHADPWNHVETAMALDVGGRHDEARRAYAWLAENQRPDGSWFNYYWADSVKDHQVDSNTVAYVATGVWHHWLCTGDDEFLAEHWPVVERAIDWVLELQRPGGQVMWARHPDGTPYEYALLTGSSSICHSLGSALHVAEALGKERDEWRTAQVRLTDAIRHHPDRFADKNRWAMDWYYPVLCGVVQGRDAVLRMRSEWNRFVMANHGVRCVDDADWVTTGETAECAMACARVGWREQAVALLRWSRELRADDGAYYTGLALPERVFFPADERTAYSAAAVVLAVDLLCGVSPASAVFR